jgi:hypothetical protein
MTMFKTVLLSTVLLVSAGVAGAQEASPSVPSIAHIPAVDNAVQSAAPSWQAVCGYKWRQYRGATGAAGRDAYLAFMRTPSVEGGCGAGETVRTRPVAAKPGDDKIQAYIAAQAAKVTK